MYNNQQQQLHQHRTHDGGQRHPIQNPTYGGHVPPATHQPQALSKPIIRQPNASWIANHHAEFQRQNRPSTGVGGTGSGNNPGTVISSATSTSGGSNILSVINTHNSASAHWNSIQAGASSNPTSIMSSMQASTVEARDSKSRNSGFF